MRRCCFKEIQVLIYQKANYIDTVPNQWMLKFISFVFKLRNSDQNLENLGDISTQQNMAYIDILDFQMLLM